jgi:tetratricopeptide (TPR) repeat protein
VTRYPARLLLLLVAVFIGAACRPLPVRSAATVRAQDLPTEPQTLEMQAEQYIAQGDRISLENALVVLEKWHRIEAQSIEPLWRTSLVAFLLADAAGDQRKRRAYFADLGERQARAAIMLAPTRVEGHYYLAVNMGYTAQSKSFLRRLGALDLVPEIEKEGKIALMLDPRFDHAGPHRLLGALYLRAPGWPASIGDPEEALSHLMSAVELDPSYPENHLYLAEALLANNRVADADHEVDKVLMLDAEAKKAWAQRLPRWQIEAEALKKRIRSRR